MEDTLKPSSHVRMSHPHACGPTRMHTHRKELLEWYRGLVTGLLKSSQIKSGVYSSSNTFRHHNARSRLCPSPPRGFFYICLLVRLSQNVWHEITLFYMSWYIFSLLPCAFEDISDTVYLFVFVSFLKKQLKGWGFVFGLLYWGS